MRPTSVPAFAGLITEVPMNAKERKVARQNLLARVEPIDPELAEEVRQMWAEEEEAKKKGTAGRRGRET